MHPFSVVRMTRVRPLDTYWAGGEYSTDYDLHIWQKQHRAEQLAKNYRRNYRSNKHGPHNRKRHVPQRRLAARDRQSARREIARTANRKRPAAIAYQAIQAMGVKPNISDLSASIRDLMSDEILGVAICTHAQQLFKRAQVSLSNTSSPTQVLRTMELKQLAVDTASRCRSVPRQVQDEASEVLRQAQAASGLLMRIEKIEKDCNSLQRRHCSYGWCAPSAHHIRLQMKMMKKAQPAATEIQDEAGHLFQLVARACPKQGCFQERAKIAQPYSRSRRSMVIEHVDSPESYDWDTVKIDEAWASSDIEVSKLDEQIDACSDISTEADLLDDHCSDSTDSDATSEVGYTISRPASICMNTLCKKHSSVECDVCEPTCQCISCMVVQRDSIFDMCADMQQRLKKELKDVLTWQDEFTKLETKCKLQEHQLNHLLKSSERLSAADVYYGLQALKSYVGEQTAEGDYVQPEIITVKPLSRQPFRDQILCARRDWRQTMAAVVELRRGCRRTFARLRAAVPHGCLFSVLVAKFDDLMHRCKKMHADMQWSAIEFASSSHAAVLSCRERSQDLDNDVAVLNNARDRAEGLMHEWYNLGSRLQEDCAQQLRNMSPGSAQVATQYHFNRLRNIFLRQHGSCILRHLYKAFPLNSLRLVEAPVSESIQLAFLEAWKNGAGPSLALRPAFHGTATRNLTSIFDRGLLIPGVGNKLRVEHGAAHGRGIYTAKVHNPNLSAGFARCISGMLVVGVLDDALAADVQKWLGSRIVQAESKAIRHVGDAMVIFDPSRVLPLFSVAVCD